MEYDERDGEGEGMEREGQAEVVDLAMLPGLRGSDGQVSSCNAVRRGLVWFANESYSWEKQQSAEIGD